MAVLIHSMCIFVNLPGSRTQYIYGENWATFLQILIGNRIARIAVSSFFVIPGYFFFKKFDGTPGEKLKRRVTSLAIPYLFWSAFTFFA